MATRAGEDPYDIDGTPDRWPPRTVRAAVTVDLTNLFNDGQATKAKTMNVQEADFSFLTRNVCTLAVQPISCVHCNIRDMPATFAAIPWDGQGNDGNWFNPANWNRNDNDNNTLPPGSPTDTDTELSAGTASLNGGLGVIYDTDLPGDTGPDNPFFPVPDSVNDPPPNFGYQMIRELYISRSASPPSGT